MLLLNKKWDFKVGFKSGKSGICRKIWPQQKGFFIFFAGLNCQKFQNYASKFIHLPTSTLFCCGKANTVNTVSCWNQRMHNKHCLVITLIVTKRVTDKVESMRRSFILAIYRCLIIYIDIYFYAQQLLYSSTTYV